MISLFINKGIPSQLGNLSGAVISVTREYTQIYTRKKKTGGELPDLANLRPLDPNGGRNTPQVSVSRYFKYDYFT